MSTGKELPLIDRSQQSSIVVAPQGEPAHVPVVNDLRHAMISMPAEQQTAMLIEYKARRDNFRDWLWSQLKEGLHYGFPPGCEPKWVTNSAGEKIGTKDWKGNMIPLSSWQPKPSLYASGADFIVEICGLIDTYEPSEIGWKQMGGVVGMAVIMCRLRSKSTNELMGESLGSHFDKKDAEKASNKALKMAMKAAKVGAVINAYGLRDLFTQDEGPKPPRGENPEADRNAPRADPRADRGGITKDRMNFLYKEWARDFGEGANKEEFTNWVHSVVGRKFEVMTLANWTMKDAKDCFARLSLLWEE